MIAGIGADLIEISRIQALLEKSTGERFLARILTPAEQELAERRRRRLAEFVAGRFAAKEAAAKALGTGIGGMIGFHDIEILYDKHCKPVLAIAPSALERVGFNQQPGIHLTITHSQSVAAAFVVLEYAT